MNDSQKYNKKRDLPDTPFEIHASANKRRESLEASAVDSPMEEALPLADTYGEERSISPALFYDAVPFDTISSGNESVHFITSEDEEMVEAAGLTTSAVGVEPEQDTTIAVNCNVHDSVYEQDHSAGANNDAQEDVEEVANLQVRDAVHLQAGSISMLTEDSTGESNTIESKEDEEHGPVEESDDSEEDEYYDAQEYFDDNDITFAQASDVTYNADAQDRNSNIEDNLGILKRDNDSQNASSDVFDVTSMEKNGDYMEAMDNSKTKDEIEGKHALVEVSTPFEESDDGINSAMEEEEGLAEAGEPSGGIEATGDFIAFDFSDEDEFEESSAEDSSSATEEEDEEEAQVLQYPTGDAYDDVSIEITDSDDSNDILSGYSNDGDSYSSEYYTSGEDGDDGDLCESDEYSPEAEDDAGTVEESRVDDSGTETDYVDDEDVLVIENSDWYEDSSSDFFCGEEVSLQSSRSNDSDF